MLERITSGGQTGADQAGWRSARKAGLATGGWMVRGYWTERPDGKGRGEWHPEFAEAFGAKLLPGVQDLPLGHQLRRRAAANVRDSDATLCFDLAGSRATDNAFDDCARLERPFRCVMLARDASGHLGASIVTHGPEDISAWIAEQRIGTLNTCGNRESKAPGIGRFVEAYLDEVLRLLREAGQLRAVGR